MKKSYRERPAGSLETPWDIAYRKPPLVRHDEVFNEIATLERGVTFFVETIEKMGGVTYFSCEGHPSNFYVLFSMPYANVRILSKFLNIGVIQVSNSVGILADDMWRLSLHEHGDSIHLAALRILSNEFEDCLTFMKKQNIL